MALPLVRFVFLDLYNIGSAGKKTIRVNQTNDMNSIRNAKAEATKLFWIAVPSPSMIEAIRIVCLPDKWPTHFTTTMEILPIS